MDLKKDYPREIRCIHYFAKKINNKLSYHTRIHVDFQDLVQAGYIGLWNATKKYNSLLGASFTTYAAIKIKGQMIDTIRKYCPHDIRRFKDIGIQFQEFQEEIIDICDFYKINTDTIDVQMFVNNMKGRDKRIMDKYLKGYYDIEIAEDEVISASRISQIRQRIIKDIQVEYAI